MKNGKRSRQFLLKTQSQTSDAVQFTAKASPQTVSLSQPIISSQQSDPTTRNSADLVPLSSRSAVSDLLLSQDLNVMKDEILQLKSKISLRNVPQINIPSNFRQEIGSELSTLKNELTFLWEKVSSLSLPSIV